MRNQIFNTPVMIHRAFAILTVMFLATSCNNDILDKEPLDAISETNVFTDPVFLQGYVYNSYNGIRPPWNPGTGGYIGMTDIATIAPDTHDRAGGIREYLSANMTSDNVTDVTNIWNYQYDYIKRVNTFFEEIEDSEISKEELDPQEARCIL